MALAQGGHGKTQFGVQAQYLIGRFPSATLLVCVGAAGSLDADLSVGDVVVGTEIAEHDYLLLFATRPLPRFRGDVACLALLRNAATRRLGFRVIVTIGATPSPDESRRRTGHHAFAVLHHRASPTAGALKSMGYSPAKPP